MHYRRIRAFLPIGLVVALAAVVAASATAAPSPRAELAGSVPPWATSANFKGSTDGSDAVGFRVYLGWRGDAAGAARAVSTPSSSSYGEYLSPTQFRQQFAPSQRDVNTVQSWLRSQGFTVDYTPQNNLYVAAEGTVAQAASAFGVSFGQYSVDGLTLSAPTSSLSLPSSLANVVQSVVGLDQSAALVHTDHVVADAPPAAGFRNAPPCSTYWGEKVATSLPTFEGDTLDYAPCGYVSAQLRGAYGLTDAGDGAGQTVAIIDAYASPTIVQDANEYFSRNGLPEFTGHQFSQVVAPGTFRVPENPRQDPQGWYGEETLDVEAVHSIAPGANIVYVGAPNNYQDLDAALNHVVDRHLANIVTNSYGWSGETLPPGYVKPYEDILVQAAAEGIGVYFSSGDSGDESQFLSSPQPDFPASSPWVTAVGGTSLGVGADNQRVFETYWGTEKYSLSADHTSWNDVGYLYGGGGGISHVFGVPDYQSAVASGGRTVPDVSMVGDPNTGFLMGQTQTFSDGTYYDQFRIGGTSLSSPLFAGVMALADAAAGHPHGFVNPALYSAGSGAYNDVFASSSDPKGDVRVDFANGENATDGLLYSVRTFGETFTLNSVPGYDDATGWGTPNASFIAAIDK